MSRIQKKKSVKDKKKRNADPEKVGDAGLSGPKPAASSVSSAPRTDKAAVEARPGEPNFFQRGMEFLREVKVELKKVTWPTRKQTTGTTIVVIIFVFVVAAFLGLFDYSLSKLVQVVLT